jgi:hypothetical protein
MINKKQLDAFRSLSDHLVNNDSDYYEIPEAKLQALANTYNKDRMVLLSWDDTHGIFDVISLNMDVDKKSLERMFKINKLKGDL